MEAPFSTSVTHGLDGFGWIIQTVWIGLDFSNTFIDWFGLVGALVLARFGLDLV
jgi:hypothetical protein